MNAIIATLVASTVLAVGQQPPTEATIPVPDCVVTLLHEVEVPAEETGRLTLVPVVLGQTVAKDDLLAETDNRTALLHKTIAEYRLNKAEEQAKNDVDYRYALKAAEVAETEHKMYTETNLKEPGTHPKITIQKAKLAWERADLQREQAQMNQLIAKMAADEARAEKDAAVLVLARCQARSPIDGIVTRIHKEEGEWVRPGEPLMQVISMRYLKVEGSVDSNVYEPRDLFHKPVEVRIKLPSGNATFKGYIDFVSPVINGAGGYDFSVKVENRQEEGDWLLHKGQFADMIIYKDRPSISNEELAKLNN